MIGVTLDVGVACRAAALQLKVRMGSDVLTVEGLKVSGLGFRVIFFTQDSRDSGLRTQDCYWQQHCYLEDGKLRYSKASPAVCRFGAQPPLSSQELWV